MDRSVATGRTMEEIASRKDEGEAGLELASLPQARPAEQPRFIHPQLATPVGEPPKGENWLHEIKYDGYRILCILAGGQARLFSRNGHEWTDRFSQIARAASKIPISSAILDGEIAVVDRNGRTDFQALQNILQGIKTGRLHYFVFDIPYCAGFDVAQIPLIQRKELLLKKLLTGTLIPSSDESQVLYSDHIVGEGEAVFSHACRLGLEGIVSKRADSPYEQRRSRNWLKVKCFMRQEFVIAGFTDPGGSRSGFGALLLGYYDHGGGLVYAGKVGTGFSDETLEVLSERLGALETATPPFTNPPRDHDAKGVHWTRPQLVAEVEFSAWTEDGLLRHPSFKGLREDKEAMDVVKENPQEMVPIDNEGERSTASNEKPPKAAKPKTGDTNSSSLALSNPDRIFYPEIGVTKRALAQYYSDIAEWIMPHIERRPLTLVRCPEGWQKECFFQKHPGDTLTGALRSIPIIEKGKRVYYSVADNIDGVVALVQMGALEIHVWGSREEKLEQPDMMVFDLDPAPEVEWTSMIEAARRLREKLLALGLTGFVKTTGGKGLHIVVPLAPEAEWNTVKAFSRAVAESIVREAPGDFIATMSKDKRRGKIFIDYLRNGRGATSVAAYSTRSRQGAPISAPLAWDELSPALKSDTFDIHNIRDRLAGLKEDPWAGYFSVRQKITTEMKKKVGLSDE